MKKRIDLVKKYADTNKRPTDKELEEAYGYLDSCNCCGKPFTFWDRISFNVEHDMMGNYHKWWGCQNETCRKA